MSFDQKHLAAAHLWIFASGLDATACDVNGIPLPESLAKLLARAERDGRREAAAHYLSMKKSGEHDLAEVTGSYNVGELEELLNRASGE